MVEDLEGEVWKDLPGYEGLYKISNKCRCFSIISNRLIGSVDNRFNRGRVTLHKDGKVKYFDLLSLKRKLFPLEFEDLEGEVWKDVPNTKDCQISNKLRVRFKTQRGDYAGTYKLLVPKKIIYNTGYTTYRINIPVIHGSKCVNLFKLAYKIFIDDSYNGNFSIELHGDWDVNNLRPIKQSAMSQYKIGDIILGKYKILDYTKAVGGRNVISRSKWTIQCIDCNKIIKTNSITKNKRYFLCDCSHGIVPKGHKRIKKTLYDMKIRCSDSALNNERHKRDYFDKGIFVCKYWEDPDIFLDWWLSIDPNDEHKYTIDRINPDHEYAPYNCQLLPRWANNSKMHKDNNRTPIQIKIDELKFKRRKKNWIKLMKNKGYKEEDLI